MIDGELFTKIIDAFFSTNVNGYTVYPQEAGKTLQNLLAEEKSKSLEEGMRFTLEYLANRNMIKSG